MAEADKTIQWPTSEALSNILYSITIKVEKHYSQKNGKVIRWGGRNSVARGPFIANSNQSYRLGKYLVSQMQIRARELNIDKPFTCPVQLLCAIGIDTMWTQKGTLNKKSGDLDNLIQGPIDSLMKAGVIEDDCQITEITCLKRYGENSITLMLLKDENCGAPRDDAQQEWSEK